MNNERVLNVITYIESNLVESLSVDDIAGTFYVNPKYLMRTFKKCTGFTIVQYVNFKRISNSLDSLINTDNKILKIALDNGFNSLEYYSETFYKIVGMSPNEFRRSNKSLMKEDLIKLKEELYKYHSGKVKKLVLEKK